MADLFERGLETGGEQFDVVAEIPRGGEEAAIGQDQRAGEIVVEPHATDLDRLFAAEIRLFQHLVDLRGSGELGDLDGDLEIAGRRARIAADGEDPPYRIEAADRLVARLTAHHAYAVFRFEMT